jgi:hypothetical protein
VPRNFSEAYFLGRSPHKQPRHSCSNLALPYLRAILTLSADNKGPTQRCIIIVVFRHIARGVGAVLSVNGAWRLYVESWLREFTTLTPDFNHCSRWRR